MAKKEDKLQKLIDGRSDFANKEMEKNYQALRRYIIQFKKDRGADTREIDHIETSDLAWDLAEHLPEGVVIKANEITTPQPWGWIDFSIVALVVLLLAFFIYLIVLILFL